MSAAEDPTYSYIVLSRGPVIGHSTHFLYSFFRKRIRSLILSEMENRNAPNVGRAYM